jgi:hypothetical protein
MKTYALVESHPPSGACRTSKVYYFVDGERVSEHDYCAIWNRAKDGKTGGYLTKGEIYKTARGRSKQCFTVYA